MNELFVFNCLLSLSLGFWIRGIALASSNPELKTSPPLVASRCHAIALLTLALLLSLFNIIGLVGMYFAPQIFRWFFLTSILGKCISVFVYPIQSHNTKQVNLFYYLESIFSGSILSIAFYIS